MSKYQEAQAFLSNTPEKLSFETVFNVTIGRRVSPRRLISYPAKTSMGSPGAGL